MSPPAHRVPPGWGMSRGAISPKERHKRETHCSKLSCAAGEMALWHRDSPGQQPTSTAKTTQPAEPPTEQPHNPRGKKQEKNQPHQ